MPSLKRGVVGVFGAIALFHAAAVFDVNCPPSEIKNKIAPMFRWYDNAAVYQSWRVFAPDPGREWRHVLMRARLTNGTTTRWFDISKWYAQTLQRDPFSPEWALSEGLDHAAGVAFMGDRKEAEDTMERTAIMAFRQAYPDRGVSNIQIQVQLTTVSQPPTSPRIRNVRYPWRGENDVVEVGR